MAKNPTPWSNNAAKNPTTFTATAKNIGVWASNITKLPASYTGSTKSNVNWGVHYQAPQTYFYNSPGMTYNDINVEYNYLVNNNTDNQRLITLWGQVV